MDISSCEFEHKVFILSLSFKIYKITGKAINCEDSVKDCFNE